MQISIIIVSIFLSFSAYDLNLFRGRRSALVSESTEASLQEYDDLQERRLSKRQYFSVIPIRYRKRKNRNRSRCNYFSTKPRDVRFSNQRKIRRMFNNL